MSTMTVIDVPSPVQVPVDADESRGCASVAMRCTWPGYPYGGTADLCPDCGGCGDDPHERGWTCSTCYGRGYLVCSVEGFHAFDFVRGCETFMDRADDALDDEIPF